MSRLLALRDGTGASFTLRRTTALGSGGEADLVVEAVGVESLHAVFAREAGAWCVRAAGGAVEVNGRHVERAELAAGDRLRIGPVLLEVSLQAAQRRWAPAVVGLGAALVTLGLLAAGLAGAGGNRAVERIEIEPGGVDSVWEGAASEVELELPLPDPHEAVVELRLDLGEEKRSVELTVNDVAVVRAASGVIPLREGLQAGANRILVRALEAPLRRIVAGASIEPLPRCEASACAAALETTRARAERLLREERVAPPNLFNAWKLLRRARGLARAGGRADEVAEVETRLAAVSRRLDERCAALRFSAARNLALGDEAAAARVGRSILATFPTDEHPCRGSGEELLRLLGDGGR